MSQFGYLVWTLSTIYILLWIPIAKVTGVLTPNQMLEKYPRFDHVIPMVVDSYVMADLLILSPTLGYVAQKVYESGTWESWQFIAMFFIGMTLGYMFQRLVIVPGKYPCTLGGAGETSVLGWMHIPYFGFAVALMLMYLFTRVEITSVIVVWVALALLAPADILVPMHFIKKVFGFSWIPDVFAEEKRLYWMIGGVECGVAALAGLKIAIQAAFR